jgi:folylpolyglutamate synthase/dihydropteroate synthase
MQNKLIIVIGAYGSGKSEYSINLAKEYQMQNLQVALVDLDVVNPYFRSRDVREKFREDGIDVIAPEGEFKHADLPMLSPRIMGAVENLEKTVILDVGGDPGGCRTLARYVQKIKQRGYEMHFVVNTKRPFTSNKKEIIIMKNNLEAAANLHITHLICNTNLMEFTDEDIIRSGVRILSETATETGLIFEKFLVLKDYNDKIPARIEGKQKYTLKYFLNKPWELKNRVNMQGI